jgi:hypothetical protein
MAVGASLSWWLSPTHLVPAVVGTFMALIAVWLWLRPEPPVWR